MSLTIPPPDPLDTTSLAPGKYTKTIVLDRIFSLIFEMLGSMQKVASAQAERLTFLTGWQKAYTDVMNQIKIITKDDPHVNDNIDNNDTNRNAANQLNTQYIEVLRNKRSIISDDAKALQSNVNTSNDAVNQQSSMGNSILDSLKTILSAIYR